MKELHTNMNKNTKYLHVKFIIAQYTHVFCVFSGDILIVRYHTSKQNFRTPI